MSANTKLLFSMEEAGTPLEQVFGKTAVLRNGAATDVTQFKFGSRALKLDDIVDTNVDAHLATSSLVDDYRFLETGDCTIEWWAYYLKLPIASPDFDYYNYVNWFEGGSYDGYAFETGEQHNKFYVFTWNETISWEWGVDGVPARPTVVDTWHHFAIQNRGLQRELWIDGVLMGSKTATERFLLEEDTATNPDGFCIGGDGAGSAFKGYIDDVRVSNICRFDLPGPNATPGAHSYTYVPNIVSQPDSSAVYAFPGQQVVLELIIEDSPLGGPYSYEWRDAATDEPLTNDSPDSTQFVFTMSGVYDGMKVYCYAEDGASNIVQTLTVTLIQTTKLQTDSDFARVIIADDFGPVSETLDNMYEQNPANFNKDAATARGNFEERMLSGQSFRGKPTLRVSSLDARDNGVYSTPRDGAFLQKQIGDERFTLFIRFRATRASGTRILFAWDDPDV